MKLVTQRQMAILQGAINGRLIRVRCVNNPRKFRLIGGSPALVGRMVRQGYIELLHINPNLKMYAITEAGFDLLEKIKNSKLKKKGYYLHD